MARLIDLGAATLKTRGLFPSSIQLDGGKIVENGIRYRAKSTPPAEPKVFDPA
jgi:hypothetical protein